jgi:D-sedoheptulose 7-phosphate isomerase
MNIPAADYTRMLQALIESAQVTTRDGVQLGINAGCEQAIGMIKALHAADRKAMVIGNGGSAAIASHMVNDLNKAVGVRAMAFNDFSLITALANDEGYAHAYEACIQQWAQADDLLIAISSSGKSENMLRAVDAALAAGARVITLTGFRADNPLRHMGDLNMHIAAEHYGMVELGHSILAHYLTDAAATARVNLAIEESEHEITFPAASAGHRRSRLRRSRASA